MTVTNPAMLDPLINALGQMNLHSGTQPPGPLAGPVEDVADPKTLSDKAKTDEQGGDDELDDVEEEMSYTPYKPAKLKFGVDHPDPVVENSTLAAVAPPDITYNLAMPADIIHEGKLSNLQLEAVVYGCQRHMIDLPTTSTATDGGDGMTETAAPPTRAGFLLGMSAASVFLLHLN